MKLPHECAFPKPHFGNEQTFLSLMDECLGSALRSTKFLSASASNHWEKRAKLGRRKGPWYRSPRASHRGRIRPSPYPSWRRARQRRRHSGFRFGLHRKMFARFCGRRAPWVERSTRVPASATRRSHPGKRPLTPAIPFECRASCGSFPAGRRKAHSGRVLHPEALHRAAAAVCRQNCEKRRVRHCEIGNCFKIL